MLYTYHYFIADGVVDTFSGVIFSFLDSIIFKKEPHLSRNYSRFYRNTKTIILRATNSIKMKKILA